MFDPKLPFDRCSSGSRGARGPCPPGPVKIGHKKDGRQRRPHRFHVSRPPPNPAAGSTTEMSENIMNLCSVDEETVRYGEMPASPGGSRTVYIPRKEEWTLTDIFRVVAPNDIWDICRSKTTDLYATCATAPSRANDE